MKNLSFFKSLLCAVLMFSIGTTLTACSDDDDEPEVIPEITLTPDSVRLPLASDGTSAAVEIGLNGALDWEIAIPEASNWISVDKTSGKGSARIRISALSSKTTRVGTVTLKVYYTLLGMKDHIDKTITVTQSDTEVDPQGTNVAQIRSMILAMNPASDAKDLDVTEEIGSLTLSGIVVSDKDAGNIQNFVVALSDATGKAHSGMFITGPGKEHSFKPGQKLTMSLKGSKITIFNGALQLYVPASKSAEPVAAEMPEPVVVEADKLGDYQAMYVKVEHTQPQAGYRGKAWYDDSNRGNVIFETQSGATFTVRTQNSATAGQAVFKDDKVPAKSGSICGIANVYNGTLQLQPRNAADLAGLDQAPFGEQVPTYTQASMADILKAAKAGNYELTGTGLVMAIHQQGVLLGQNGSFMFVFLGATHDLKIGDQLTSVKGPVAQYHEMWQFGKGTTYVKGNPATVNYGTPTTFGAAQIDQYVKSPSIVYLKVRGTLSISGNYTNLTVEGTSVRGSLSYASDQVRALANHLVEITGYAIGATSSYVDLLVVKIEDLGSATVSGIKVGAKIDRVAGLKAGSYYMAGYSEKYDKTTFAPYSWHVWSGEINGGDCVTEGCELSGSELNPKSTFTPGRVELVAVAGKSNTYYIKVGAKYLDNTTANTNRKLALVDAPHEWVFADKSNGDGLTASNDGAYLMTAGAASKLIRTYKTETQNSTGVFLFEIK